MQQCAVTNLTDLIETCVKCLKIESRTKGVVVANFVNFVVVNIKPLKGFGDERKVKPLKVEKYCLLNPIYFDI